MHGAKIFTNNLTIYYCLQCRNGLAKNWQKKKKKFLINVRLQNFRLKQPEGLLLSNRSQLFYTPKVGNDQLGLAAAGLWLILLPVFPGEASVFRVF